MEIQWVFEQTVPRRSTSKKGRSKRRRNGTVEQREAKLNFNLALALID
jgi:hypothetical protein